MEAGIPLLRNLLGPRGLHPRTLHLPDRYVTHGKPALLREEVGLTPASVAGRVAEALLTPSGVVESV